MNNKFTKTMVIGLVIVLVLALGAVAAFAQDDTTTPDTETTPTLPSGPGGFKSFGDFGGRPSHHDFGGTDDEALASALGISVEELQAARQKVYADRLAQAVEDGTLTQDQADSMQAMNALKAYLDRETIMAEALGMTVDEYEAARADGSLSDILANITSADLQAQVQAATEAAVQQAVGDEVITQAQGDLVLEQIANGTGMIGGFGGGHHSRGGMDFGGPRGFSAPPADDLDNDAQPTSFGA